MIGLDAEKARKPSAMGRRRAMAARQTRPPFPDGHPSSCATPLAVSPRASAASRAGYRFSAAAMAWDREGYWGRLAVERRHRGRELFRRDGKSDAQTIRKPEEQRIEDASEAKQRSCCIGERRCPDSVKDVLGRGNHRPAARRGRLLLRNSRGWAEPLAHRPGNQHLTRP